MRLGKVFLRQVLTDFVLGPIGIMRQRNKLESRPEVKPSVYPKIQLHLSRRDQAFAEIDPWFRPKPENETIEELDVIAFSLPLNYADTLARIESFAESQEGRHFSVKFRSELQRTEGMPDRETPNSIVSYGAHKIGFYDSNGDVFRRVEFDHSGTMNTDWRIHSEGSRQYILYIEYRNIDFQTVGFAKFILNQGERIPSQYLESKPKEPWTFRPDTFKQDQPLDANSLKLAQEFIKVFGEEKAVA